MNASLRRILGVLYPERQAPSASRRRRREGGAFSWGRFFFVLGAALVLVKLALFYFYYNAFISLQYDVEEAAAQTDAQLQRRRNIILNLNIMVTDYADHEKELFRYAADKRNEMVGKPGARPRAAPRREGVGEGGPPGAAGDLEALLSKIFAVAERYPDLRLSENFQRYMDALVDAETKIAETRMAYNERANDMSTAVGRFPGFVFARLYGFEPPLFYEPEAEARNAPRVESTRQYLDTATRRAGQTAD
jgi:LemA protein